MSVLKRWWANTALREYIAGVIHSSLSYSEYGEDVFLAGYYKRLLHDREIRVDSGVIVDIGAFRPIRFNNTYRFYRKGWRSINVDPAPGSMELFRKVRSRDNNVEVAIADEKAELTFYVFDRPSVWNTLDQKSAVAASKILNKTADQVKVPALPLKELLEAHRVESASFEILCIDAEGLDLVILQSNDFSRFRPRVVLIEVHDIDASNIEFHPVVQHLVAQDYKLYAWPTPNLMFIRGDSVLRPRE